MFRSIFVLATIAALSTVACASTQSTSADMTMTTSNETSSLTEANAKKATEAITVEGTDCALFALEGYPIALKHFQDDKLVQSVGLSRLSTFGGTPGLSKVEGATVATIVGQTPSGAALGNHHIAFNDGMLRTKDDVISMKPTSDKCKVDVNATINFADGSGKFAGYSGKGVASGTLNFCGPPGDVTVYGKLCKAAH